VLRPRFGRFVALAASALFATAPWAVLYGRKIWPQDALPVFTASLLWVLFLVLERTRSRAALLVPPLLCICFQLNISALALVLPAGVLVAYRARDVNWRALGAGIGVAAVLLAPWLAHETTHGFKDAYGVLTEGRGNRGSSRIGSGSVRAIRETIHISGASHWDYVTGPSRTTFADDAGWAWRGSRIANALTAALLAFGLVSSACVVVRGAARRSRPPWIELRERAARRALLVAWLGGIWLTYATSAPGRLQPHYLIVTYPVVFIFQALALRDLSHWRPAFVRRFATIAAACLLIVVAASYTAFTVSFHRFLERHGGTAGDYGVTYDNKLTLARAARSRGLRVANEPVLDFLVAGRMSSRPGAGRAVTVVDTLRDSRPLDCAGVVRSSGPLRACFPRG
jgi:hypothetical protein